MAEIRALTPAVPEPRDRHPSDSRAAHAPRHRRAYREPALRWICSRRLRADARQVGRLLAAAAAPTRRRSAGRQANDRCDPHLTAPAGVLTYGPQRSPSARRTSVLRARPSRTARGEHGGASRCAATAHAPRVGVGRQRGRERPARSSNWTSGEVDPRNGWPVPCGPRRRHAVAMAFGPELRPWPGRARSVAAAARTDAHGSTGPGGRGPLHGASRRAPGLARSPPSGPPARRQDPLTTAGPSPHDQRLWDLSRAGRCRRTGLRRSRRDGRQSISDHDHPPMIVATGPA